MKILHAFLVLLAMTCSLQAQPVSKKTKMNFEKLYWLEGNWVRVDNEPDQSSIELWLKKSQYELTGKGITLKSKDTLFVEKLKIIVQKDDIFYVSDVPENPQPVSFKFTKVSSSGFVCENPQHDFPKKIEYQRSGKSLKATISGDGKSIDYSFVKK